MNDYQEKAISGHQLASFWPGAWQQRNHVIHHSKDRIGKKEEANELRYAELCEDLCRSALEESEMDACV